MKKLSRVMLAAILLLSCAVFVQAQEARLLRFPTVSANSVAFTYAGDLYSVPLAGGMARKLTTHNGFEMFAKFSPDGKTIAFTGQYDGNTEVFTIPAEGGMPKRLTTTATLGRDDVSDRMGPNNIVMAWTPDSKSVIFRSRKQTFNDFVGQLFKVSVDGGMSEELPLISGGFCSYSPDGKQLAFNRVFREFRTWKYYKGGMADDIWIFDSVSKQVKQILENPAQDIMPMWIGNEIFFISDRDRIMNLFAYNVTSGAVEKVTDFTEYDIKFPSFNGSTIVFENGGFIYRFDAASRKLSKIDIKIADDNSFARPEWVDAAKRIFSYDLSPDGERVVFSARGDVFTLPSSKGITRNITASAWAHDRSATWSPNGKYIAYLSDMSGEYEIYMQAQDGSDKPIQLTSGADTYKYGIQWSPDSKKVLWTDRAGRLQYVNIDSRKVTLVEKGEFGLIYSFDWSPDSKWITFSANDENRVSVIYLYNVDTKVKHAVTNYWYSSSGPVFSNDGKYLVFESDRDFDPIYSQTEWNHAYQAMSRLYMVLLSKDTPSPFALENNEVKVDEAKAIAPQAKSDKKGKADAPAAKPETAIVKIDVDGIADRIIALPVDVAYYGNYACVDGKVYFSQFIPEQRKSVAKVYDLNKKSETELGEGLRFRISASGKKMLVAKGRSYAVVDLPSSKVSLDKPIDLSNMKVWVDYSMEWKQIYDESWRQMRDFFYVENMHGVDWKAMHAKYSVLLPYVKHRADLTYIIGELIGELNVGHAYVNSGDMPRPERINVGLLGAKLSKQQNGYFRIDDILQGASWSKTLRSPLQAVGANVAVGDYILAVDGQNLSATADIYQQLIGKANQTVELLVNSKPDLAGARKVLVEPIADESQLYYYRWVQGNIKKVNDATNGEVGYIHIPDMGVDGLNEFVKHFYPQLQKKALVIDDRGNGGGNVSPMLLERLAREPYRANMRRGSNLSSPIPAQTHIGPKVLLINNYSASDGDLFPYGFRQLKLGPIIGVRTWGGIVGISGSLPFVDGGDLRKPEFTSYGLDSGDWIIEGYGVDPDIRVDNDPYREYMGIDDQLNKAIEVALEQLKNRKPLPPIPAAPDRSK